ncbi:hypothetical protein BPAE_0015g00040 [Botrytis paeoniae]|uniref:Uncharacterized protein n=1 Tax=Botrytis paeoniae TaxID=278948 RepID=A0A4Z1G1F5_9HELO|nr:hypothetical protein BPAE_0015g00040 [Botrytis paeoniae]
MPTTDMNSPSNFKRFLSPPLRWLNDDIESQQSQQSIIHSFHDPSPQMHHSTDHPRDQHSRRHDDIETPYSSYAVEDHDIQGANTQSFAQNPRQTLTNIPIRRPRSTSNPELQFSIPGSFTQEENNPRSQSGNQNPYFNNLIRQRRHEDSEIDLEGQYTSTLNQENHAEYELDNSFGDRHCRISDTHDKNSIPYFLHRANESQSQFSDIEDPHQNTNPESTSVSTQRPRRRSHPGNGSPRAEPLALKPPAIPIDLDFSGVIQTLRRPIDYFGGNKEEIEEMWQCVPNEDLEERMLGCYAWNHEDKNVCVGCRRVRTREARSKLVALKRALGFRG